MAISQVFNHADVDIAVSSPTVAIDMGDPLPTGAIVLATIGVVSEIFGGGGAVAVTADVGRAIEDDDLFTPTPINLHAGAVVTYPQFNGFPAAGYQLAVTINSDVDLDTLTGGELTVTVLYVVPSTTTVEAPEEEA